MKKITIFTATLLAIAGVQAQSNIEQVLRNIEANNKELQANAPAYLFTETGSKD